MSETQLADLAAAYDQLANAELGPLPQMANDAVRTQIDEALSKALGWPDLTTLREMLAREPVVGLNPLT